MIHLGPGLDLPIEAVTETFAILGKRGSGKTSTAVVLVEELIAANLPVAVVDPVGVWHGLRHAADGRGPGLPVVILGGEHADLPLEETAGAVVAELVVEARQPIVIDLSGFSKGAARRFMTDFAERLYHLKSTRREPLHLVLDEADGFAPQRTEHGGERLLGAINDLVRRGRARGIGCTLITQRPAVLNKDVLSQAEVLVALRLTGPHDRKAIETWVEHQADPAQAKILLGSLAELPVGTAWVWSPGWLGIFKQVAIRPRRTFDSSATPKAGGRVVAPGAGAVVDLDALRRRMADTIEKAKADDPKALRDRIAWLERVVAGLERQLAARPPPPAPLLTTEQIQQLQQAADGIRTSAVAVNEVIREVARAGAEATVAANRARSPALPEPPRHATPAPAARAGEDRLLRGERAILQALATFRHDGLTREQLATLAGYAPSGGGFNNYVGALRGRGLIERSGDRFLATDAGCAAIGPTPAPATTDALVDLWCSKLTGKARDMLRLLVDQGGMTREALAHAVDMEAHGGGFNNYLGTLRSNGLVVREGSEIRASGALFLGTDNQRRALP